jgi:hypothetical protein
MLSLSLETQIGNKMKTLGVTADFLAALSRVAPTRFSIALRGIQNFSNEEALHILKVLAELETLVRDAKPFPLALTNPSVIGTLLEKTRERQLRIVVSDLVDQRERAQ